MKLATLSAALILAGGFASAAQAQTPLPMHPTMTAQEKANLQLVRNWWREVIQAHHVELIDEYADPNMKQHNPNAGDGTAVLKQIFGRMQPVTPIPAKLPQEPEIQLAQGDIVLMVWGHDAKDPKDPSKTYHYTSFDGFRIANGKIVEHWDSAMKSGGEG